MSEMKQVNDVDGLSMELGEGVMEVVNLHSSLHPENVDLDALTHQHLTLRWVSCVCFVVEAHA